MNATAYYANSAQLIQLITEHIAENTHCIVLINDLGSLGIFEEYEQIAPLKEALEKTIFNKKDELYETLASFLPTTSPQTQEMVKKNLKNVFAKIGEERFYQL